jgi:hypothetical protein
MTNPITDAFGDAVLTGLATPFGTDNDDDSKVHVCVGIYDPDDGDPDPHPILILAPDMALALADEIAGTAGAAHRGGTSDGHNPTADTAGHRCAAVTGRLLLARITDNYDAFTLAANDVGDCVGCWQRIASQLTAIANGAIAEHHGQERAVRMAENLIAHALDASEDG